MIILKQKPNKINIKKKIVYLTLLLFIFPIYARAEANTQILQVLDSSAVLGSSVDSDVVLFNYIGKTVTDVHDLLFSNGFKDGNRFTFYPSTQFILSAGTWKHFEYATTTLQQFENLISKPSEFSFFLIPYAQADTFYSQAGDGHVLNDAGAVSWNTAVYTANGTSNDDSGTYFNVDSWDSSGNPYIQRVYIPFYISGLGDYCVGTSSLVLYNISKSYEDNDEYAYLVLANETQSLPGSLENNDYGEVGFDDYSDQIKISSLADSGYNYWHLNNTATSSIINDSYFYLGLREGHDIANNAVTGNNYAAFYSSEYTGTTYDPYLIIEVEQCSEEPEPDPESTATTTFSSQCDFSGSTDLSIIRGCSELYGESTTTPEKTTYYEYHIPALPIFLIFGLTTFIGGILIREFQHRWRKK